MNGHDPEAKRTTGPRTDGEPETAAGTRPSRRRLLAQALGSLLVLALAALAVRQMLGADTGVPRRGPVERQAPLVQVERAQVIDATVAVTAWGRVVPSRELTLSPRVAGRVDTVGPGLEPGALLAAGDTVLEIDPSDYELALTRARTTLTEAKAELSLEQGRQTVARREFELLEQETDAREQALMLRKPQLETARAAVEAAEADVADARLDLEHTRLAAPFDTLVLSRSVAPGAEVTTGTEVARLVGVDTWWVELTVPVPDLRWIRLPEPDGAPGSAVRLRDEGAWDGRAFRDGQVVRLLGDLESGGRMARLLVAVDDPLARDPGNAGAPRLLLGAFMRAEIRGRTLEDVVAIEPAWLRPGDTVWVVNGDGRLAMRDVTIAHRSADRVLISEGLARGDRIVTTRIAMATEGMPLRATETAADAPAENGDA